MIRYINRLYAQLNDLIVKQTDTQTKQKYQAALHRMSSLIRYLKSDEYSIKKKLSYVKKERNLYARNPKDISKCGRYPIYKYTIHHNHIYGEPCTKSFAYIQDMQPLILHSTDTVLTIQEENTDVTATYSKSARYLGSDYTYEPTFGFIIVDDVNHEIEVAFTMIQALVVAECFLKFIQMFKKESTYELVERAKKLKSFHIENQSNYRNNYYYEALLVYLLKNKRVNQDLFNELLPVKQNQTHCDYCDTSFELTSTDSVLRFSVGEHNYICHNCALLAEDAQN